MKKQLLTTLLATAFVGTISAQLPVSTSTANRNAVLEEFTGIYCGFCPDGHLRANNLKAANPSRVVLINIHSGGYANVNPGEPDLKTTAGNAIDAMPGNLIAGYPAGTMNRTVFGSSLNPTYSQTNSPTYGMAQSRGTWSVTATNSVLNQPSYVNVALQGSLNVATRVMSVEVQVYYTANSPAATNSLTVMLLENKIIGPQANSGNFNPGGYNQDGSYNHNHALRHTLTPNFGMTIPNTTSGTTFTTMLTYTVPNTYGVAGKTSPCQLGNLELAAFVTQTDRPIITGANGPIIMTGFTSTTDIGTNSFTADKAVCSGTNFATSVKFFNFGSQTATNTILSYAMNGGTPGTVAITNTVLPYTSSPPILVTLNSFTPQASNTIVCNVVSVNGATDQVAGNNTVSATASLTGIVANHAQGEMAFTQDRYGAECTWTITEEATGNVAAQGGPYTNLGANGTQLHTSTFVINPGLCYKVTVRDGASDGINAGYGAGGYIVKAGGVNLITSNGMYTDIEKSWYKSSVFTGIGTNVENIGSVNVYPNPASNIANLTVNLTQNESVNVSVINTLGQEVYSSKSNSFNAGENNISINTENWAAGTYFINVSTEKGSIKQKLTVVK